MQSSTLPRKEYYTHLMTQELIQSLSLIFRINKPFLAHRQISPIYTKPAQGAMNRTPSRGQRNN